MTPATDLGQSAARDGLAGGISVIIPHYDDLANLGQCLAALGRQAIDRPVEIIVADNNSPCDRATLEALCAGRARLVDAPIQGAAPARNAGVQASSGELLAFIDSDCRPSPTWLAAGVAALARAPLVGGRIDVAVPDPSRLTAAEAFERVFAFNNERYVRQERFSVTANLFTTRAVFEAVGGFRNGVSEDVEWGQRAFALGYRWAYAADAQVDHPARENWAALAKKWRRLSRESYRLARERRTSRARWLLRNWLMVCEVPLATIQVFRSARLSRSSDRLKAVATLCRLRVWRLIEAHRLVLSRTVGATPGPGGGFSPLR